MAVGLAAELKNEFGLEAEMIESGGGVFEVILGDDLIFSKKALDRHAEDGEVATLVRQKIT
jgi:selenoprotein W-related protein